MYGTSEDGVSLKNIESKLIKDTLFFSFNIESLFDFINRRYTYLVVYRSVLEYWAF
jgi:hypothetical protein